MNPNPTFQPNRCSYRSSKITKLGFSALTIFLLILPIAGRSQQCTLPSQIFLPQPDKDLYEGFGSAVRVDGNHMVVGIPQNSATQAIGGLAYVYKLDGANQWIKIAELTPSDLGKYTMFGRQVAISGNTIVLSGSDYTGKGGGRDKLYVFEKPASGEWVSTTENYTIEKPFISEISGILFEQFVLRGNDLIAQTGAVGMQGIEVYRRTTGQFELIQSIPIPGGSGFPQWNLAIGDDFFAMGTENYSNPDNSSGAVFVYEKTGPAYNATPAVLKAAEQSASEWRAFGLNIAIHATTLFVQGLRYDGTYNQVFYIMEKPMGGWVDASYPALIEEPGYAYRSVQIAASENYLLAADEDLTAVIGFKKPATGWGQGATRFRINDPANSGFTFGRQLQLTDTHLVIGCPNWLISDHREDEVVLDLYRPGGDWENVDISQAAAFKTESINATDDFFGEHFSVFNGQLAVTADGDDQKSWSSGLVYMFDVGTENTDPVQIIHCPEEEDGTGFGQRIAMGDSLMFITAPYKDSVSSSGAVVVRDMGKVYVYRRSSSGLWEYSSQIKGPATYSSAYFGRNVVSTPGYCAISEFNGGNSDNTGKIHIYKENADRKFQFVTTLGVWAWGMGYSMAMTDSVLVVGTSGAPTPAYRVPVWVFHKIGEWSESTPYATLDLDIGGWRDGFGTSVSINGDEVVVGAPGWPGFETRPIPRSYLISGAAFIYRKPSSGWSGELRPSATITPRDPTDLGGFGEKVALDHNDLFIGAPNVYARYNYSANFSNDDGELIPGKVYHFTRPQAGWTTTSQETRQIQSFEPEVVDGYGSELFISDRYLFVGAMLDDTPAGIRTGSVQTMMQLPVVDGPNTVCIDEGPILLQGHPRGGQFSGPGVNVTTGVFSPTVAGPGTHNVRYVRDGCKAFIEINVIASVISVSHRSELVQPMCIGRPVSVAFETGDPAENYKWFYRPTANDPFEKYDSLKQVVSADKPGIFRVVISRGLCPPRIEDFEVVDEEPIEIEIAPVPAVCAEGEIVLSATPQTGTWMGQGVSADGVFNSTQVADASYELTYTVTTPAGCVWQESTTVNVSLLMQPQLQYGGEAICGNAHVTLRLNNVDGISNVTWFKDGAEIPSPSPLALDVSEGGTYVARVQKSTCEYSTQEAVVPKEAVDIIFNIPILCADNAVTLNVTPSGGTWSGAGVTESGVFDASLVSDGNYPVQYELQSSVGCHWQEQFEVVVDKLNEPLLESSMDAVCMDAPATLSLSNVDNRSTVSWHSEQVSNIEDATDIELVTDQPGTYWATILKANCTFSTAKINLIAGSDSLFVPNVFTPNNDELNDYFEIRSEGVSDFHLSLYNRYGRKVYDTDNLEFKWEGDATSPGIYFWRITYRNCLGMREERRGWLDILKGH
jgi:gliding motility-associated-like protein